MATAVNKPRLVNQIFGTLKGKAPAEPPARPVLEQFLYAICREGATRSKADRVFANLKERFFDWNEVRVSSVRELADVMEDLPEAETRAQRIIDFCRRSSRPRSRSNWSRCRKRD